MGFEAMLLLFGDIWFIWFGLWCLTLYYYISCNVEPRSWRDVLNTTLCDKVCQRLATGRWFSPGTAVSSTNKTNHHNITEILLRVALRTLLQNPWSNISGKSETFTWSSSGEKVENVSSNERPLRPSWISNQERYKLLRDLWGRIGGKCGEKEYSVS
jgi:hypothetical protein